jgi:hypothetical protein
MNPLRNEYRIEVGEHALVGKLDLTLLKSLEGALGARSVQDIGRMLADPSAEQMVATITVAANGALTAEQVATLPLWEAMGILQGFGEVFTQAFAAPEGEQSKGKPGKKSPSRGVTGSA